MIAFVPTPGWRGRAPTHIEVRPLDLDRDFEEARHLLTTETVSTAEPLALVERAEDSVWLVGRSGHMVAVREDQPSCIRLTVELAPQAGSVNLRLTPAELRSRAGAPVNLAAWIAPGREGEESYGALRRALVPPRPRPPSRSETSAR